MSYEIAQVKFFVKNESPGSVGPNFEGIVVYPEKEVCMTLTLTHSLAILIVSGDISQEPHDFKWSPVRHILARSARV